MIYTSYFANVKNLPSADVLRTDGLDMSINDWHLNGISFENGRKTMIMISDEMVKGCRI